MNLDTNKTSVKLINGLIAQARAELLDGAFKFNLAADKVGLALEHPGYVKRNCKKCHGRGFMRFLTNEKHERLAEAERHACDCVHRGYEKKRFAFQRLVNANLPVYLAMESDDEEQLTQEQAEKKLEEAVTAVNADILNEFFADFKGTAGQDAARG